VAAALVNIISAEIAGRINAALASVLIFVLLGVAVLGWVTADAAVPAQAPTLPPIAVFAPAFMMVFFAFTGWEVGANLGGEFRNPKRDLPLAMGLSFVLAVTLYAILALVVQRAGLTSGFEAPFATIFGDRFGAGGRVAIGAVSVLLIFAKLSAAIWAVSRMVYSAAGEGLLPAPLTATRWGMPARAVALTVFVLLAVNGAAWGGLIDLSRMLGIAGLNFLLLYAGSAAVLLRLAEVVWQRLLALASLGLVAALLAAHGAAGLIYPGALILAAVAICSARRSRSHPSSLEPGE
jgi:amino acid efflux transporter